MAKKIERINITNQEIEAIYDAGKEVTVGFIRTLVDKFNDIAGMIEKQQEEIDRLKAKIDKDSHNSNKPPSTDNPYTKKKTKSQRKKGGKVGGQKGHKGSNLKLSETPDKIINLPISGKCDCGANLRAGKHKGHERRQVIDLPEIKTETTEYQAEIIECACGQIHMASFPDEVNVKAQYGSGIKALVAYLKYNGFLSFERIADFIKDVLNQEISQGTLVNIIQDCSEKLEPFTEQIKENLTISPVVHFDETGFRIEGSLHWLHSAGNDKWTYYFPHKKRGAKAMLEMGILPYFQGIAVHDHLKSYYHFSCLHGLCNSHHLRELIFFEEQGESWASNIKECLLSAKEEKDTLGVIPQKRIKYYRAKLHRLLNIGLKQHPKEVKTDKKRGRKKQSREYNFLNRIKKHIDDTLRFILNKNVPFDNNLAERDIRMTKVQQKVSGTFRSFWGARSFCIIRSYISTLRKQDISVFHGILGGLLKKDILGVQDC